MPRSGPTISVSGTTRYEGDETLLLLDERLTGHSTFLTGELELWPAKRIPVRILTFDDVTVLHPQIPRSDHLPAGKWQGTLHLPHGRREPARPDDLSQALEAEGIDPVGIEPPELRHLLTYLGEATSDAVRQQRITIITTALRERTR